MWPARAPNGWLIDPMARGQRSYHVRKHLLNRAERWGDGVCTLSNREISALAGEVTAAGCACGRDAAVDDAPGSPGHDIALGLYASDYLPVARIALEDAFEGRIPARGFPPTADYPRRSFYAIDAHGVVVVCAGEERLRWRTAYRRPGHHRRDADPELVYRRHLSNLRKARALWAPPGVEP